jgi:hypothetical protein
VKWFVGVFVVLCEDGNEHVANVRLVPFRSRFVVWRLFESQGFLDSTLLCDIIRYTR